jgi:hypothetical protein
LAGLPTGLEAALAGAAGGALFGISADQGAGNQLVEKVSRELARSRFAIVVDIAFEDLESFERHMKDIGGTALIHPDIKRAF